MKNKTFLIFWLAETVSMIGSEMTSFGLSVSVYRDTRNIFMLSLMFTCIFAPKIICGLFRGAFADRFSKRAIVMLSDTAAALATVGVFLFSFLAGRVPFYYIIIFNLITGSASAFQFAAFDVSMNILVPPKFYTRMNGIRALGDSTASLIAQVLGAALFAVGGLDLLIGIDLTTFVVGISTVLIFVRIKEPENRERSALSIKNIIADFKFAGRYIGERKILKTLTVYICLCNVLAGFAFFSMSSAMILSKTDGNAGYLAAFNVAGGIAAASGGLIAGVFQKKASVKRYFLMYSISFIVGDLLFALAGNIYFWCVAAAVSLFPLPVGEANEAYVWQSSVPVEIQGRVLAFKRWFLHWGILTGSLLANICAYFLPKALTGVAFAENFLGGVQGLSISLMFLTTSVLGGIMSLIHLFKVKEPEFMQSVL
jgi:Major Facilitator Superfamily.